MQESIIRSQTKKTPEILTKLRKLDINDKYEIIKFLEDLKSYQNKLCDNLNSHDGDDLIPAIEKSLQGLVTVVDVKKIDEISKVYESGKIDNLQILGGDLLCALMHFNVAASANTRDDKELLSSLAFSLALTGSINIIQATLGILEGNLKPSKDQVQTIIIYRTTLTNLKELNNVIKEKSRLSAPLPKDYFKDRYKEYLVYMDYAKKNIDPRSSAKKILDNIFETVVHTMNKVFKFLTGKNLTSRYLINQRETREELVRLVEKNVYDKMDAEDISLSDISGPKPLG